MMKPQTDGHLEAFAENLPGAAFYFEIDANGQQSILFLNEGCAKIWAVSKDDFGNDPSPLWEAVHPDDLECMQHSVRESAENLSLWEFRFRIRDFGGTDKTLLSRGTPSALPDGGVRWLTFLFDVTAQTKTEELFETVSQQLDYISSAIPDGFALFDRKEQLVVCNALFRGLYGIPFGKNVKGKTYEEILQCATKKRLIPGAFGREDQWIARALDNFRAAEGRHEEIWNGARWMKIIDRPTEDGGRVTFRIETTETVNRKKELELAAATDTLTGLLNRRGLADHLTLVSAGLAAEERIAVLHVDLDKFKKINDANGHEAGDLVLAETARRLKAQAGDTAKVARVGGDEFVVVRVTRETDKQAAAFAEYLRTSITDPVLVAGRICQVGATVGLAIWTAKSCESIEQTLMDADTALTAGKSMGRNQTVFFQESMRDAAVRSAGIAAQIKDGLSNGAFEPFFQPQVAYPEGRLVGLEALARWKHSDGSYQSAASFIEVANETGLIAEIENRILGSSLDMLSQLHRLIPIGREEPRVSINLSSVQLGGDAIVERLLDELLVRNLSTDQVAIEILETTLLDDRADKISQNIDALANAGFRIELDDFGTGHTALASLTSFPVHQIKVDRSLIEGINDDPKKQAIAGGLFVVCEKLGIEAIAEGVETHAELQTLCEIGFTLFQGYYFGAPMPAIVLLDWIEDRLPSYQPHAGKKTSG